MIIIIIKKKKKNLLRCHLINLSEKENWLWQEDSWVSLDPKLLHGNNQMSYPITQ